MFLFCARHQCAMRTAAIVCVAACLGVFSAGQTLASHVSITPVAVTGDEVTNLTGLTYNTFGTPSINGNGDTAFFAAMTRNIGGVNANNDLVIAKHTGTGVPAIARKNDAAPGTGENYSAFNVPAYPGIADDGDVTFISTTFGSVFQHLHAEAAGTVQLEILRQSAAPGLASANGVNHYTIGNPRVNADGEYAFQGQVNFLGGPGQSNTIRQIIYKNTGTGLEVVALQGNSAPGVTNGDYNNLFDPALSDNGKLAFKGQLTGGGIGPQNNTALFVDDGTGVTKRVIGGDAVADLPGRMLINLRNPDINDAGRVAFVSGINGGPANDPDDAVFRETATGFEIVVTRGATPPDSDGTPQAGQQFTSFQDPAFNDAGRVAFVATYDNDTNGSNGFTTALFAENPFTGLLTEVVATGDTIETAPGVNKIIDTLTFQPMGYNDADQIAFQASFTDGSQGVFVTGFTNPIPEPTTGLLLGGAMLLTTTRRR